MLVPLEAESKHLEEQCAVVAVVAVVTVVAVVWRGLQNEDLHNL
jgi:hypothetical protein